MKYRSEIDGLRALAVIPVILFHAGFQQLSGGFVGVDIFFVISGYLITSILLTEMNEGNFSLINFYERRARRILPVLFFVILCCLPFAWFLMLPSAMESFSKSMIAVTMFGSNFQFWSESGYFDVSTHFKPLLHTWSLAVEEQYYVFFPLFLMSFWKFGKSKLLWMLGIVFITSLAVAYWGAANKPNATFYLLPFRAWELLLGAFAAFYLYRKAEAESLSSGGVLYQALSLFGLILILSSMLSIGSSVNTFRLIALMPTVGATLIILFASKNTIVGRLLSIKPLVGIGLISYSAYLWHQPVFAFARLASEAEPSKATFLGLSFLTMLMAWVSWKFIENPFRNKHKFNRKIIFKLSIVGSLIIVLVGVLGVVSQGYLSRYAEQDQYLASLSPKKAGAYVAERFFNLQMKAFNNESKKTKVLVIGDSYAEDLINSMYEVHLDDQYQFSTRHIKKQCGNLYLPFSSFKSNISSVDLIPCEKTSLFTDEKLKQLLESADEVWFASAWQYWQAGMVQKSLSNIDVYGKKVRVFGSKSFGDVNVKHLLSLSLNERLRFENRPSEGSINTNALLRKTLEKTVFIDVERLICNKEKFRCPLFTKQGELISYDGGHLTPIGAEYLGAKLKAVLLK